MAETKAGQIYTVLREAVLRGDVPPGGALKPQELADAHGVSLAVVREALVRLAGDGLADRMDNRGFAVPTQSDRRWQELAEARCVLEPELLRLAIARGDLDWEARVRAAHHRLARTPPTRPGDRHVTAEWSRVHHEFHRALLDGCGNAVLLETFDRLWLATELARRWSADRDPDRDYLGEHRRLEEAALARDADAAADLLARHVSRTAERLR
ncbi:GntR family transcriptional regulator [Catenuloplanes atrovinosus]|uniref:DNA-binding GntR family transcriptional regulator n=1 Tax=Catenuloplanes atrovinosus TaxID=137266 RepID=A0AAE3YQI8_9ACTN|nr:GntR family transcriptional regulator [Catenuloplanes atrovinosus]MDR7276474.1 DNA-binding GntR family transcriptional regulator [Catenuloplanes atrovinosus]